MIGTSYAVLAAVDPLLAYGFVGHITKENFTYTTRLAGVDSVERVYTIPHEVKSAGLTLFGPLNLGPYIAKTIVGGVLTLAREGVRYSIAGEGGVADELVTINGTNDGDILIFRAASSTVDITVKHGVGNVYLNGKIDFVLTHSLDSLMFENHSGSLKQLGGGDNQT